MSRRDKNQGAPMSFFSFQDIIACITGIMVLVTLLLALELTERKPAPPEPATVKIEKLEELLRRKDQLRRDVAEGSKVIAQMASSQRVDPLLVESKEKAVQAAFAANKILTDEKSTAEKKIQQVQQDLAQADKDVKQLTSAIARMENRLTRLPGKAFGKQAVYVECSGNECVAASVVSEGADQGLLREMTRFAGADAYDRFRAWAAARRARADAEAYVLLVRPEAAAQWQPTYHALAAAGFEVGWDVWPAERQLLKKS